MTGMVETPRGIHPPWCRDNDGPYASLPRNVATFRRESSRELSLLKQIERPDDSLADIHNPSRSRSPVLSIELQESANKNCDLMRHRIFLTSPSAIAQLLDLIESRPFRKVDGHHNDRG